MSSIYLTDLFISVEKETFLPNVLDLSDDRITTEVSLLESRP